MINEDKQRLRDMAKSVAPKKKGQHKEVDLGQLEALCQYRVPIGFVAHYFGVSTNTIGKRIRENFDMTFTEFNKVHVSKTGFSLQQKAVEMGLAGNATMLKFALKNLSDWVEDKKEEELQDITVKVTNYNKKDDAVETTATEVVDDK